ncbi:MAG: PQQ-like beta-propeller repeat protein [Chloroflexi bacterium]|nr:MAG: PQQ-like beta-propeller repeat protein [Chloroflexota bacterium]
MPVVSGKLMPGLGPGRALPFLLFAAIALQAAVAPAAAATPPDESVTYQVDPGHSGAQSSDSLTPPLARKWSVDLGARVSYPVIGGGEVFVIAFNTPNTQGSTLYAFDANSGRPRWGPVPLDSAAWAGVAYDGAGGLGRVFVVSTNATQQGLVTAFDATTGTQLWQTMEPGEQGFNSAPLPVNGTLYVTPGFGQQAINEVTGAIEWTAGAAWPGGAATATGMYTTRYDGCHHLADRPLLLLQPQRITGGQRRPPVQPDREPRPDVLAHRVRRRERPHPGALHRRHAARHRWNDWHLRLRVGGPCPEPAHRRAAMELHRRLRHLYVAGGGQRDGLHRLGPGQPLRAQRANRRPRLERQRRRPDRGRGPEPLLPEPRRHPAGTGRRRGPARGSDRDHADRLRQRTGERLDAGADLGPRPLPDQPAVHGR